MDLVSTFADAPASKGATYDGTLLMLQLCELRILDLCRGQALPNVLDIFLCPSRL